MLLEKALEEKIEKFSKKNLKLFFNDALRTHDFSGFTSANLERAANEIRLQKYSHKLVSNA